MSDFVCSDLNDFFSFDYLNPNRVFSRYLGTAPKILLSAGDVLYVPKGVEHNPYTKDNFLLHLTIGIVKNGMIDNPILCPSIDKISKNNIYLEFFKNIEKFQKMHFGTNF